MLKYQAATITTTTKNKKREKKEIVGVWFNVQLISTEIECSPLWRQRWVSALESEKEMVGGKAQGLEVSLLAASISK